MFNIGDKVKITGTSCGLDECEYCIKRMGGVHTIIKLGPKYAHLDDYEDPIHYKYLELVHVQDGTPLPLPG